MTTGLRARLDRGESIDLRGDGKAGGGLVLAVQAFGAALAHDGSLDVQDWPLFSSARKGANVRAYLRAARGTVQATCAVTQPDVAVLMNEAAAREIDFAEGTRSALYVVNTNDAPAQIAERYRLGGTVVTIAGDALGETHLGRPLGNIAVFAALVRATGLVDPSIARASLVTTLKKRRLQQRIVDANLALFDDAIDRARSEDFSSGPETDHRKKAFEGYGALPPGAQSSLRTSVVNHTAGYGRPGVSIAFADPTSRCNGCSLCVVQCPEGIIEFEPDRSRGAIVYGAKFADYCKVCRECVAACPLDLFSEIAVVARPEGALREGG
jgi:2-oxoacid:acceptor oxidoreductase gamma subunit (pyruvate/2-ketoisovalerate family)